MHSTDLLWASVPGTSQEALEKGRLLVHFEGATGGKATAASAKIQAHTQAEVSKQACISNASGTPCVTA